MRKVFLALVGVLVMLVFTACPRFTAGGWICSTEGLPEKATFGFQVRCDDEEGGSGQLQFNDHGAGVAFHAVIMKSGTEHIFKQGLCSEEGFGDWGGMYFGEYMPIPKRMGAGGYVEIYVNDLGDPGPDSLDIIEILLIGGVHDGYFNTGLLQGGQITMH